MNVNLVLFKKDGSQKVIPLRSSVTVIGRRHSCDLCIPLMSVSKRHCQLYHDNGVLKIRDLGSRGGTFLNGRRIDEATVRPGDYIMVGPLTFLLQIDGEPKEIVPPGQAARKPAQQETPTIEAEPADESFPELDLDESDSFLDELEDI